MRLNTSQPETDGFCIFRTMMETFTEKAVCFYQLNLEHISLSIVEACIVCTKSKLFDSLCDWGESE